MSDAPDQQAERRVDLAQKMSALASKLEQHITEEIPMVEQLGTKIAEIRAEQRVVLQELTAEQAKVLGAVKEEQAVVRAKLDTNTQLTQEVRDILTTFKMVGGFAKWFAAIVAAIAGAWAAIKGIRFG